MYNYQFITLVPGTNNVKCEQIYVFGSSTKLGKWKAQDGLKLSYAGDSIWHADCVLPKTDFPIKYPCVEF